jgi:plasmid stabilization system protein ParE
MTRVVVSPQARDDLLQIIITLSAAAGPETANRWDRKIWQAVDDISQFPGSGAPRPALGENVRIVPVPPYVVLYEHARGSDAVHLLRVVHGRRNISKDMLPG